MLPLLWVTYVFKAVIPQALESGWRMGKQFDFMVYAVDSMSDFGRLAICRPSGCWREKGAIESTKHCS